MSPSLLSKQLNEHRCHRHHRQAPVVQLSGELQATLRGVLRQRLAWKQGGFCVFVLLKQNVLSPQKVLSSFVIVFVFLSFKLVLGVVC